MVHSGCSVNGALDRAEQYVEIERFGNAAVDTQAGRIVGQLAVRGHDDDRSFGAVRHRAALLEELPAAHDRHHQVEHDRTWPMVPHAVEGFGAVARGLNGETVHLQGFGDERANRIVVVDNQHVVGGHGWLMSDVAAVAK